MFEEVAMVFRKNLPKERQMHLYIEDFFNQMLSIINFQS